MTEKEILREALQEGYDFLEKHAKILPSQIVGVGFRMKKALTDTEDTGSIKFVCTSCECHCELHTKPDDEGNCWPKDYLNGKLCSCSNWEVSDE